MDLFTFSALVSGGLQRGRILWLGQLVQLLNHCLFEASNHLKFERSPKHLTRISDTAPTALCSNSGVFQVWRLKRTRNHQLLFSQSSESWCSGSIYFILTFMHFHLFLLLVLNQKITCYTWKTTIIIFVMGKSTFFGRMIPSFVYGFASMSKVSLNSPCTKLYLVFLCCGSSISSTLTLPTSPPTEMFSGTLK